MLSPDFFPSFVDIDGERYYHGYTPVDPDAIAAFADQYPAPPALAGLAAADDDGDRYNYRALVACLHSTDQADEWLFGNENWLRLGTYNQGAIGSCVGNADALQRSIDAACDIVIRGDLESFRAMFSPETAYGLSREIAGMLGRGDGSYGAAAAKAADQFGCVNQLQIDAYDLRRYSVQTCRTFGARGVPAPLKEWAKAHRTTAHAAVNDTQTAWTLLGHGYAFNICSGIGFQGRRDDEGVIRRAGGWSHSMCVSSRRTSKRHGRLFLVHQSWGPNWTSGPYYLDQPLGSFWITEGDLAIVLRAGDTFSSTGYRGFEARPTLPDFTQL